MEFAYLKGVQDRLDVIRTLTRQSRIPANDRFKYSIKDIKPDGFVRLNGDICHVMKGGRYDEWDENYKAKKEYSSHEFRLLNLRTGQIVLLEWDEDDQIVSACTGVKKLKWSDLADEAGEKIDEDDLEEMGSDDGIKYNGKTYWYEDDWAAKYVPSGKRNSEKAWIYEFEADDKEMITIEEWGGGEKSDDYEIWHCLSIDPNSIEIIAITTKQSPA
ncbi:MAG: DUF4178 domain-containing protein [Proteobacteria bacterium]|nr:DUF4178 domain-containing protein [Pseudomonadota bacterium]